MNQLKAYCYVIVSGVALAAGLAFAALQWGSQSQFSAYGPPVTTPTIYLVLGSAAGGVLAVWMARLMARGLGILRKARREREHAALGAPTTPKPKR